MLALPLSLARWAPNSINRPIHIDDLESALGSKQSSDVFSQVSASLPKAAIPCFGIAVESKIVLEVVPAKRW